MALLAGLVTRVVTAPNGGPDPAGPPGSNLAPAEPAASRDQPLWPAVFAGGMLGSGVRWLAVATAGWSDIVVVDAVNVLGAFLLGAAAARLVGARSRAFWLTGVLGSLTTWSTFMVDAVLLTERGDVVWAVAHVFITCGLGLVAARAGQRLTAPLAGQP